ncbi:cytochrome C oxidase subunit IV family protein [Pseudalkalibacillus hwajinpoensis]|uniref:cytochrome C oxidase subunit IV family protein n=1 Tax=Guptibacillus hwajinpoensis TaxID=208199 RepID=UPI00325AE06A
MKSKKPHVIKLFSYFIVMIVLTVLAFCLVMISDLSTNLLIIALLTFACIQIVIQLQVFMELTEKEGRYRITSIVGGSFIALLTIFFLLLL